MKKFNHLNIPDGWRQYWSRYPQGYTIIEALIDWVSQVDDMVDNQNNLTDNVKQFRDEIDTFIAQFDNSLQGKVTDTLSDWQSSGFLDIVIDQALNTKYHEMDDRLSSHLAHIENDTIGGLWGDLVPHTTLWGELYDREINIKWFGAVGDGETDDTQAFQNALETINTLGGGRLFIPKGAYPISATLNIPKNTTIIADQPSTLLSTGNQEHFFYSDGNDNIRLENIHYKNVNGLQEYILQFNFCDGVTIDKCVFDGSAWFDVVDKKMKDGNRFGVEFYDCNNVHVTKTKVKGIRRDHALKFMSTKHFSVTHCTTSMTNRAGISINSGSTNGLIEGNSIRHAQKSFPTDGAIDIYGHTPYVENIIIRGNTIKESGSSENQNCMIRIKDCINITIENNTLVTATDMFATIQIQDRDEGAKIEDISITNNKIIINHDQRHFIHLDKGRGGKIKNLLISGNSITSTSLDSGSINIIRGGIENLIITNNHFESIMTHILINILNNVEKKNVVISNNQFNHRGTVFSVNNASGVTFSNNQINNGRNIFSAQIDDTNDNVVVIGNIVVGEHARFSIGTIPNMVVENNLFHDTR